jgi:acyl-CoA synthetase (AMP-forming)/AMP-acid ligase II
MRPVCVRHARSAPESRASTVRAVHDRARGRTPDHVLLPPLLGRRRRSSLSRRVLLPVPGRLASRRLDQIDPDGSVAITGRPDATINRGGVRMGTAEIYAALDAVDEVLDAIVVDVDGWLPLFVVLAHGMELDAALERRVRDRLRDACSPRHVPSTILRIDEVPLTLSGKRLEVPVTRILAGAALNAVTHDDLAGVDVRRLRAGARTVRSQRPSAWARDPHHLASGGRVLARLR